MSDKEHGWLNRQSAELFKFREALNEIAYTQNVTATPKQFAIHLQRIAKEALEAEKSDE